MKKKNFCKRERNQGTIIFPAIEISNEIEKIKIQHVLIQIVMNY